MRRVTAPAAAVRRARVRGAWCVALAVVALGVPVSAQQPAVRPAPRAPLPVLPLTQLDEREQAPDLDSRTFTVSFVQPTPMRDVLMMLVRGTNLSIVPGPDVNGAFIGELKGVTVRRALDTVLPPFGLDYAVDGSVVHVFRRERETRLYDLNYIATLRTGAGSVGAARSDARSWAQVSSATGTDVFAEIERSVRTLLSDHASLSVDRQAGLLQVTDYPERLDRVANYLEAVQDRVHRQVEIDARVIEVELDAASAPATPALRVADVEKFLADLAARGKVTTLAAPRLLTLNNEPAIVRGADEGAKDGGSALTLSVTPQIGDGVITLSLSPIVTLAGSGADGRGAAASRREADTLARVADGETLVVSGFGRDRETRERKVQGIKGGWFGRTTVVTKKRVELLVLLTPRIVNPIGTQD